jgi:hypothetical protein
MSKRAKRKSANAKRSKSKLGPPDLDHSKAAVRDSLRSPESKRGYQHAIDEFIQWYCSEPRLSISKIVVTRYRIFLESRGSKQEYKRYLRISIAGGEPKTP